MTQNYASRTTLADVISALSHADLTDQQRRDQISAVRTIARALGAMPEEIPVDVQQLRARLDALSPGALGVSAGRWANVRSLFGRALRTVRPMLPSRSLIRLSPEWAGLLSGLDRNRATRLKPLLRCLSQQGITPDAVTAADLHAYRDALTHDRLRRGPERTWDSLVWSWNACVRDVPGWPAVPIERASRRETYTLPWTAFLDEFQREVQLFLHWRGGVNLSEHSPSRPARPATLRQREYQLRMAASVLVHRGLDISVLRSLRDLVTAENVRTILDFLLDRHNRQATPSIGHIAVFLKYVAERYLELDDTELVQIRKLTSKVVSHKRGLTPKNRERLRPFDDPETVAAFLSLPERIRAELARDRRPSKPRALVAQVAAAIAILQAIPLRIGNLARLDLRKNLIERGTRLYLVLDEDAVKNGEFIDLELPAHTIEILGWYLREHRPTLLASPSDWLFPGEHTGSKSSHLLGSQITKAVHRYLGLRMHAHLFRHVSAKLFLDQRPGEYEVVRQVLRHRSIETTTNFYAGAELRTASAHFASVIEARRNPVTRRRRRRGAQSIAS